MDNKKQIKFFFFEFLIKKNCSIICEKNEKCFEENENNAKH